MDEKELLIKLRQAFSGESVERITAIGAGLVALEKTTNPNQQKKLLEGIYREAHSLKGAARAVNLRDVESTCQALEGVFSALKTGRINLSPDLLDVVHESLTFIEILLVETEPSISAATRQDVNQIAKKLEKFQKKEDTLTLQKDAIKPLRPVQPVQRSEPAVEARPTTEASIEAAADLNQRHLQPAVHSPLPTEAKEAKELKDQTHQARSPLSAPPSKTESNVRISTERLDQLLRRAEELISLKLTGVQHLHEIHQVNRTFEVWHKKWGKASTVWATLRKKNKAAFSSTEETKKHLEETGSFLVWNKTFIQTLSRDVKTLAKTMQKNQRALDKMIDDLLDTAKQLVMLPSATTLEPLPRMVREFCRELGKEVTLSITGSDTEIDRRILESMRNPIIHLLRNAVDHGIETPEERLSARKSRQGNIQLTITQQDSSKVSVTIQDDGRGIDIQAIKKKVLEKGGLRPEEIRQLTHQEALSLILLSGISSSPIVTDLSGRGLGMAIVHEEVEKLGGNLSIQTEPGKGTCFTVELPVSLSTFRGVIIQTSNDLFIIPTIHVESIFFITQQSVRYVKNKATIPYGGFPLALVELGQVLGLPGKKIAQEEERKMRVVVLGSAEKRVGFRVDEVLGEQEVLVKGLGKQLRRVRHLSGATILGSGRVVPILNTKDLLETAESVTSTGQQEQALTSTEAEVKRKSILIVEDSITSRMLLKNILEAAGYRVETAVDGLDGLTHLKTSSVNLVISDVEMPRMNGFELTEKIRADTTLAHLPLILVTSLSAKEDRERGVESGANAYIVKSSFDQSNLLEVIGRLI